MITVSIFNNCMLFLSVCIGVCYYFFEKKNMHFLNEKIDEEILSNEQNDDRNVEIDCNQGDEGIIDKEEDELLIINPQKNQSEITLSKKDDKNYFQIVKNINPKFYLLMLLQFSTYASRSIFREFSTDYMMYRYHLEYIVANDFSVLMMISFIIGLIIFSLILYCWNKLYYFTLFGCWALLVSYVIFGFCYNDQETSYNLGIFPSIFWGISLSIFSSAFEPLLNTYLVGKEVSIGNSMIFFTLNIGIVAFSYIFGWVNQKDGVENYSDTPFALIILTGFGAIICTYGFVWELNTVDKLGNKKPLENQN